MKYVEFYKVTEKGTEVQGTALLKNDKVMFKNMPKRFVDIMKKDGIIVKGKVVKMKEGIKFLKGLKYEFSGSRFRASDVKTK